ncbi:MAG: GPI anchored serine-threonine rich family protein, partial [Candidatus Omnitrophica bacterium]|nr:GPI anchored serine-threonine rich family protein [Candidatus Omnitrophota bacterium]
VDDIDWKTNDDGSKRRVWSYFTDHTHEYQKCATAACTDSDGGKDYYTKGKVEDKNPTASWDICYTLDSSGGAIETNNCSGDNCYVSEHYCQSPDSIYGSAIGFQCSYGCQDGACVKEQEKSITVLSPNGGETWEVGEIYTVKWSNQGINKVNISLIRDESNIYPIADMIAQNISASLEKYSYKVPDNIVPGDHYKVQVYSFGTEQGFSDESDNYFSIVAQPSLIYSLAPDTPLSATVYQGATNVSFLSFQLMVNKVEDFYLKSIEVKRIGIGSVNDFSGPIKLFYGSTQVSSASLNSEGTATFAFSPYIVIPKSTSKAFMVKADISSVAERGHQDGFKVSAVSAYSAISTNYSISGDAVGNIMSIVAPTAQPSITVLYPNGGERLTKGETYEITWSSSNNIEAVDILLSECTLSPCVYSFIVENISNTGTYVWNAGAFISGSGLERIVDIGKYKIQVREKTGEAGGEYKYDESDNYFSIIAAATTAYSNTRYAYTIKYPTS